MLQRDVIIIGAGPAGCACANILRNSGLNVLIVERTTFPRFTIGESFLPQNMDLLEEAGLSEVFNRYQFRQKNGAQFLLDTEFSDIDFINKFSQGPHLTYQVQRDKFDKIMADIVQENGVEIKFNHSVLEVQFDTKDFPVRVKILDETNQEEIQIAARFIVDASGLARVLPRLLNTPIEHNKTQRTTYFNHFLAKEDCKFDNDKILITVDRTNFKNWFWTIPLGDKKYSLGVITEEEIDESKSFNEILPSFIARNPTLQKVLGDYKFVFETKKISGYSAKSSKSYGEHYVCIGNSGEFLDPIFSSGVTIALKSACLCAKLITKELKGEAVDWRSDFEHVLHYGLATFKNFVQSWYDKDLIDIIMSKHTNNQVRPMIISVLAGYAWDKENPYTQNTQRRLKSLAEICR